MATSTFATLGLGAIAPYLRSAFDLSTFEVGILPALVFLGSFVVSIPAGRLTDRIGAGRALVISQLGVALSISIAAVAPSRFAFLAAVGVAGLGYGAVNPATNVLSTSLVPRDHRALFLSVKQTGVTLGGLLGGLILPGLADAVGWRACLMLPIGLLLASAGGGVWVARREAAGWFTAAPSAAAAMERRVRISVPGGFPTGLFGFVMSGVQLSVAGYLTVYLVDTDDFSRPAAGFALGAAFFAACAGRIAWGYASDRWFTSHARTLVVVATGSFAALTAIAAGAQGAALWIAVLLVGFCSFGWNGVYMALITDRAAGRGLGHATGRGLMFLYGGVVLVPPTLGAIKDGVGSWTAAWVAASLAVLVALSTLALGPRTVVEVDGSTESRVDASAGAAV
ncbi:MAG TPA: MFS transporter [Solirubrobacteraceae bacterium]|nr:MFS transporter [Solirubrobacteraceae bacterium]